MTKLDRIGGLPVAGAAEAEPMAERDAEGGVSCFSSPKNITGGPYVACVVEDVGSASISYVPIRGLGSGPVRRWIEIGDGVEGLVDGWGELIEQRPKEIDWDKMLVNIQKANGRAKKSFLQFCVKNRLTKMWTLTYGGEDRPTEKNVVKVHLNQFFKDWRERCTGGEPFPYAYILERHKSGHLHVHIAVQEGFTDFWRLHHAWGKGRIQYDEAKGSACLSGRELSRCLARYLSKYLTKSFIEDHSRGEHRYERSQGFEVVKTRRRFNSWKEAREWLESFEGELFEKIWSSWEDTSWVGPPVEIYASG